MAISAVALFGLVSTSVPAQAQEPVDTPDKPNAVIADLSLGVLAMGYERRLTDWFSAQLIAHYYRPWYISDHVFGFGGELRPIFYLLDRGPEGLYVAPGVRVSYVRAELEDGTSEEGVAWSARVSVGWGFLIANIVSVRLGAGIQYHRADLVDDGEPNFDGVYPVIDLFVGLHF